MHKKDYIVRQFEELGKVMAVILGLKKLKDWENFEKEITAATQKFTGLDLAHIESLSQRDFEQQVLLGQLALDQKKMLADLLFEKMNAYLEQDDKAHYIVLKHKCLALYSNIRENFTENEFDLNVHYRLGFLNSLES